MKHYKRYLSRGDVKVPRSTRLMRSWRQKRKAMAEAALNEAVLQQRGQQREEVQNAGSALDGQVAYQLPPVPEHIPADTIKNFVDTNSELGFVQSSESSNDCFHGRDPDVILSGVNDTVVNEPTNNIATEDTPVILSGVNDTVVNEPTNNFAMEDTPMNEDLEVEDGQTHYLGSPLPPLCSHTDCTADDVLAMTLSLAFRHNLTYVAIEDILKMFNAVYGGKKMNTSKYSFMKRLSMQDKDLDIEYHYYCDKCSIYVCVQSENAVTVCHICETDLSKLKSPTYFASMSMKSQLRKLLADESIADAALNYRFSRKVSDTHVSDIYDGSVYSKLSAHGGILSVPQNFSYSFFVDGVPVGKTKKSLWPIYISINELPPEERRKNILLVGLYYGARDPNQAVFLKPFVDEANILSSEGFKWSYRGQIIHSLVIPLVAVADSVARCQLLNMQTFSAVHGCTFCYQRTQTTAKKLKFVLPVERVELRCIESYKLDLMEVKKRQKYTVESKRQHRGVKGISCLAFMNHFDLFSGCVVDSMHCILQGVCKTYFELLFENERRNFWLFLKENVRYSVEDVYKVIDSRIQFLQPPTCIPRAPRSIKDHASWKANEWRSWLLFYCIPCLTGLLKSKYLKHFAMLSKAYYILMQQSVSRDEIAEAHHLLQLFIFYYQKYFGEEYMYYNIHLLGHICRGVSMWGPLWTHNAFMYEAYNRQLLYLCKSPYQVVKEVCQKYLIMKKLPRLVPLFASSDDTLMFCQSMLEKNLVRYKRTDSCILMGAGSKSYTLTDEEKLFIEEHRVDVSDLIFYNKVLFRGMRISTSEFACDKRHNDSILNLVNGQSCKVIAIFSDSSSVNFLIRYLLPCHASVLKSEKVEISHIVKLDNYTTLDLFKPTDIQSQCILIQTECETYYSKIGLSLLLGD